RILSMAKYNRAFSISLQISTGDCINLVSPYSVRNRHGKFWQKNRSSRRKNRAKWLLQERWFDYPRFLVDCSMML
ncbi:hypothetical protein, partial [Acinetobacter baumannii]|uniref:hypothetical protein n=1 Tax=Acinetobacter baumannii TaxID=470 RepID=UPI00339ABEB6